MNRRKTHCHTEQFVRNLRLVNRRAGVDPQIVDLLAAYTWMRLYRDKPLDFYGGPYRPTNKAIQAFLKRNRHLDPRTQNFLAAYHQEMNDRGLCSILNDAHLAHLLETPLATLNWLADGKKRHYARFKIPKRNGSYRIIDSPKRHLKTVQRKILDTILHRVRLNSHAVGFVHRKSILTNARRHVGQKVVIKMDISDFFPSITFPRVAGMFEKIGYPHGVAVLLAKLTTHQGRLPIGAPTSPAISNIVCRTLDKRFVRLSEKVDFTYSRYADDIAVSSNDTGIISMIPFYKQIIKDEGFVVNQAKTAILRNGGRQKITGVVVNTKANAPKEEVRKLRAVLHNCRTKGVSGEMYKWAQQEKNFPNPKTYSLKTFQRSLRGKINFIKFVNPEKGAVLIAEFNRLDFT